MKFRTYHEVTGSDASAIGPQVSRQQQRIEERLARVGLLVGVMSGKGGVGKTYVTAGLALAFGERGLRVGVLDADLAAPTAARVLGASGPVAVDEEGVHPATGRGGVRVFSTDLLLEEGAPLRWHEPDTARFVWRGTLEAGALREFLSDVVWGDLDVLLIDLPPGTDRLQDLAELAPGVAGVIAVTIPSEESRRAVGRAMRAAREAGLALLGVVENMSGYACPGCGARTSLFPGDAGDTLAAEFGVPLVARIPFTPTGCPTLPVCDLAGLADLLHPGAP